MEMHGEIVDRGASGCGDVLGPRAGLPIEKGGEGAEFDALFVFTCDRQAVDADLHDAVAGGDGRDDRIKVAVDANLRTLFARECGVAWPAIGVAYGQRGYPDIVLRDVGAVVASAVAFAQFFHVDDASLQADRRAEIHDRGAAKFVFGIDAVNRHARAHHIQERVGMLEKTEAGSGVFFAEGDAFFFEESAGFVEAAKLLFVERWGLDKGHHRPLDLDRFAAGAIANERRGHVVGHTHAADAGVDTDVERNGFLRFGGDIFQKRYHQKVNP